MSSQPPGNVFFYVGNLVSKNLGDWLIAKVLLERLSAGEKIFCRQSDRSSYGVSGLRQCGNLPGALHLRIFWEALKSLFNGHQLYYICPPGHSFSVRTTSRGVAQRLYLIATLAFCHCLGVKICRFGISVGPLTAFDAAIERWMAKVMHFYSVRDSWSMNYVESIGITGCEMSRDLSLLSGSHDSEANIERDTIVYSFRESILGKASQGYDQDSLTGICRRAMDHFLDGDIDRHEIVYQAVDDLGFCRKLKLALGDGAALREVIMTWDSASSLYARTRFAVSNRLHVLLIGMEFGAVPIPVVDRERHTKVACFFEDAGLAELIFDIAADASLEEYLDLVREREHALRRRIRNFLDAEQKKLQDQLAAAFFDPRSGSNEDS